MFYISILQHIFHTLRTVCLNGFITTATCKLKCSEGQPSEDCSLCVCEGHMLFGDIQTVTGVPLAGASVALTSHPKVIRTLTDTKGQFTLSGVCSSTSTSIAINKEKFVPVVVSTSSNATGVSWLRAVLTSAGECQ